jgi:CHAT domain-containing protein
MSSSQLTVKRWQGGMVVSRFVVAGIFMSFLCHTVSVAYAADAWQQGIDDGISLRQQGRLQRSVDVLRAAKKTAQNSSRSAVTAAELGATLLLEHRFDDAEVELLAAFRSTTGEIRARVANDLGNLYFARKQQDLARNYLNEASRGTSTDPSLAIAIKLNLIRMSPQPETLNQLQDLVPSLSALPPTRQQARLLLNLGEQASQLGVSGLPLAYSALDAARRTAEQNGENRLRLEAMDALSQLYEDNQRWDDLALLIPATLDGDSTDSARDLQLSLEWRLARALISLGHKPLALAAIQRAVEHAQAIRADLPIESVTGISTYRSVYAPLYETYIQLLLESLAAQSDQRQQITLGHVRDALEATRQAEMHDFLGDRCTIEEPGDGLRIDASSAVLYPILLNDRIDLLLATAQGLWRTSTPVSGASIRSLAREFATALRNGDLDFDTSGRQLHAALIAPIEERLRLSGIRTLVLATDGELRLVPFAALPSGSGYLGERFAIASVTGMSMTSTTARPETAVKALLAGVAEPGGVVTKLASSTILDQLGGESRRISSGGESRKQRTLRWASIDPADGYLSRDSWIASLKQRLALPEVDGEIHALGRSLAGKILFNQGFTVDSFKDEAESGSYKIVHVASHGIFGGTAESSFILAYDDVIGINRLQTLLESEHLQQQRIELLSLSACETADGNERAPLGIAGAAIRARAKAVLGTLWSVDDNAARQVMEGFYAGITIGKLEKAAALQQAQLKLRQNPQFAHPFYWAPFTLIGNWR